MAKVQRSLWQSAFIAITLIAVWQGIVIIGKMPTYILPTPYQVGMALYAQASLIIWHGFLTFSQVLGGLFIATLIGILVALLLDHYQKLLEWIQPVLLIMQATPTFILMPLFMLWFGFGLLPKMIVVCLSAFFPITICFLNSLKRTPLDWLELATVMKARPFQTMWHIRWPAAFPGLFSGLRLASIHAPLTVLAADWNGANEGLGYLIMLCHGRLQIDFMFACLFCTVLLTLFLNRFIQFLETKLIFWPATC